MYHLTGPQDLSGGIKPKKRKTPSGEWPDGVSVMTGNLGKFPAAGEHYDRGLSYKPVFFSAHFTK